MDACSSTTLRRLGGTLINKLGNCLPPREKGNEDISGNSRYVYYVDNEGALCVIFGHHRSLTSDFKKCMRMLLLGKEKRPLPKLLRHLRADNDISDILFGLAFGIG